MLEFTTRFRDRVTAMLRDASPDVAAAAVVFLHEARRAEHVPVDVVTSVLDCLLCPALVTRRAAADFLVETLTHMQSPALTSSDEGDDDGGEDAASAGRPKAKRGGATPADGACVSLLRVATSTVRLCIAAGCAASRAQAARRRRVLQPQPPPPLRASNGVNCCACCKWQRSFFRRASSWR